jgi:hypothetical protein
MKAITPAPSRSRMVAWQRDRQVAAAVAIAFSPELRKAAAGSCFRFPGRGIVDVGDCGMLLRRQSTTFAGARAPVGVVAPAHGVAIEYQSTREVHSRRDFTERVGR